MMQCKDQHQNFEYPGGKSELLYAKLVEFSEDKEQMDGKILFYPNYPISYNWVLLNNDYLAQQEEFSISSLRAPGIKL